MSIEERCLAVVATFDDQCPKCGDLGLEALTFKGLDFVGVGCFGCDWIIAPPGWTPPMAPDDEEAPW